MKVLASRCFHHAERAGASRCPSCRRDFCTECVSEHEDRYLCVSCIRKLTPQKDEKKTSAWQEGGRAALGFVLALAIAWLGFLLLGGLIRSLADLAGGASGK